MFRKKFCVLLTGLLLFLSSCGVNQEVTYTIPDSMGTVDSGVVLENEQFSLRWDSDTSCVLLEDRQTAQIWSTTPYDFYVSGEESYSLSSPVVIEYYDPIDNSIQIAKSYDCVEEGYVEACVRDGELTVTYYFADPEITVGIAYGLREDSMTVSLNTDSLMESGKTKLINVSLVPYLSAVANTEDENSYLFVPSGSGALMYTDESPDQITRYYSGEVYGNDIARTELDHPGDDEPVRLPVFGVKNSDYALLGVIEKGEGAARIDAIAGDSRVGYSTVYATFNVRGYNNIEWESGTSAGTPIVNDVVMLNDSWPASTEFVVGYYPLTGQNANYNGMAARYRQYLESVDEFQASSEKQQLYHITLLGGAQTKKFLFGIPYESVLPLTTFDAAKDMVENLSTVTGRTPSVLLQGFGTAGVDVGKLGGGFRFSSVLGNLKEQQKLEAFCKELGAPLFTDFDIVRFNQTGGGFSTFFDIAQTANSQSVYSYPLKTNVRVENTEADRILYLKRSKIQDAVKALEDFTVQQVSGIGLTTFGRYAYSDYSDEQYMLKGGLTEQTASIMATLHEGEHSVLFSAANAYAAGQADAIIDVPLQNGDYNVFDAYVPFYQLVYKGRVPLYSTPINLALNAREQLLRAVEVGVSPAFMLSNTIDTTLYSHSESYWYGVSYESNIQIIKETMELYGDYLSKVSDAGIRSHTILQKGVTKTEFDNGVIVIVNHSDANVVIDGQEILAHSFHY